MEEKRRILEMVRSGEVGVEEALALLEAVEARPRAKGPLQVLRVRINAYDEGKPVRVNVNLPLALAELLGAFLPQEAKLTLANRGVDLKDLLRLVRGPFPLPLFLGLPLLALEWGLLLALFLRKTRALLRGKALRTPLGAVFALRGLPPLVLWELEGEGIGVKVGVW